jgi:hypothetical protein
MNTAPIPPIRLLIAALLACVFPRETASGSDALDPAQAQSDQQENVLWYDLRLLGLEGQGWSDVKAPFDRLPAKAEPHVRPEVWGLSRHSAGLAARFVTGAATIKARWTLTSSRLEMPHMPATGVSGLDLYVKDGEGRWRWLAIGIPKGQSTTAQLVTGLPEGEREYLLYLPLYNGVQSVEIGIPQDVSLKKAPERPDDRDKPIVFYGTSITQGGCASRPGMVHTAILGRRLDRPVINLGFSGNGRLEADVAKLLAELDAAVFVIDCLPNVDAAAVSERTEPLVRILREKHLETPIVLVEDRSYSDSFLLAGKRNRNETSRAALRKAFDRLQDAGVKNLHYLEGENLLGDDNEGTVDSSHPTDLGFVRQADVMETTLRAILESKKH